MDLPVRSRTWPSDDCAKESAVIETSSSYVASVGRRGRADGVLAFSCDKYSALYVGPVDVETVGSNVDGVILL